MPNKDIVVVGTSAGGIEALRKLLGALPPDFPATVFVVQHLSPDVPSLLAQILERATSLPVQTARDGERFRRGRVYVAPPDRHLMLGDGDLMRVTRGPKENRFRPAVDPLFRSAARAYGPRVVGVVLTGGLDDGTTGLLALKQRGGTAVVQDPADALVPSMPLSAVTHVKVDYCLPLAGIGPLLVRLATEAAEDGSRPVSDELDIEVNIALEDKALEAGVTELGEPSSYACPDCHGVLLRLKTEGLIRFRCHTGHAYTADSLLAGVSEGVEDSLWNTIRALEEGEMLLRHLAGHMTEGPQNGAAEAMLTQAADLRRRAALVRQATMGRPEVDAGKA
ncbi:MAG TPA: chemotaxis protein CheB [Pyrinomonadaceae bacterium]|nr:chemotaxis protein CheB [Pyrinomonadaceae bacterium]